MANNKKVVGSVCIIITTACYGMLPALSFLAFRTGVETETLLFDKFLYAAVLMWAYVLVRRIPFRLKRGAVRPMLGAVVGYVGIATTLYFAFDYISGSLATIVSFTFPAMIIAIEMVTGKEKARVMRIAAVVISLVGLVFIVWSPDLRGNIIGIMFAIGTALCYVVYTMSLASEKLKEMNTLAVAGYVLLASAIFNFFRCFASGKPLFTTGFDQLWYMLLLAVLCAFVAILCFCQGVKMIGAGNAAIINTFEPVFACFCGYMLVGDVLTRNMIIGSVLVVAAVLIANLPDKSSSALDVTS